MHRFDTDRMRKKVYYVKCKNACDAICCANTVLFLNKTNIPRELCLVLRSSMRLPRICVRCRSMLARETWKANHLLVINFKMSIAGAKGILEEI